MKNSIRIASRLAIAVLFVLLLASGALVPLNLMSRTKLSHVNTVAAADIDTVVRVGATQVISGGLSVDAVDFGRPPLSIGTVVADDSVVAAQQGEEDDALVPSFAPVEQRQLAAVAEGGKPMLVVGNTVNNLVFTDQQPKSGTVRAALQSQQSNADAEINVWYGATQPFGQIGMPQTQINILGSISEPTANLSVTYSLNNGAPRPLSLGPDTRRLAAEGDFNADIPYSELVTGTNTVQIIATDHLSTTNAQTVTVNYAPGNEWPLPYTTNWAAVTSIQERSQVVDGLWALNGGTVRPLVLGYDRLVGIGDIAWRDYEVTVPVTIHAIDDSGFAFPSNGPGVGLILRWQGHFQQGDEQPENGWQNFGAIGWYRWAKESTGATIAAQQMLAYQGREIAVNPAKTPDFDVPYLMKMSVQSAAGKPSYYRFKTWRATEPEPVAWDMEAFGRAGEPQSGSLLLVAHHVDATFGDVTVQPLNLITSTLEVGTDGNGAVVVSPEKESYAYGDVVTLNPTGNSGFAFDQWSGDLQSTDNPLQLIMTTDISLTASFVRPQPVTVTVSAGANGTVQVTPQKSRFEFDEQVVVTAVPAPGFEFAGWGGDAEGLTNPLVFNARKDVTITATFVAATLPVSDDFNQCRLNDALWTVRDPKGDATISLNGEQLLITVPANSDHDLFEDKNFAPRIMQDVPNEDFAIEVKFESQLSSRFQTQGIIVEEDTDNFLRMEFFHDGTGVRAFAALFQDGKITTKANQSVSLPVGSALYMRLTRVGDQWTQERSFDGLSWVVNATFEYPLTVSKAGVYGGNVDPVAGGDDTAPAHTAVIDYFFNTASPLMPEDNDLLTLATNIVGDGTIVKVPEQVTYACDEPIQLTAVADANWAFDAWSGVVTGATNPITLTLSQGSSITATFSQQQTLLYLPFVAR